MREIRRIVIHHSASSRETTASEIRGWHRERGWSDIGYHVVIEGDGQIRPGRSFDVVGAHAKGHNDDSIGVCVVGDNTDEHRRWTDLQCDTLRQVVGVLEGLFPGAQVVGHRDLPGAATACPGLDVVTVLI